VPPLKDLKSNFRAKSSNSCFFGENLLLSQENRQKIPANQEVKVNLGRLRKKGRGTLKR
jgi:hypothetical protein